MADKKLNAVSTARDGAYIYAEDASGNQIKISKADLASVVAGIYSNYLLSDDTQKFKSAFSLKNNVNLNDVNVNSFVTDGTNMPEGVTSGYLEVLWTEATGGKIQRFTPYPLNGLLFFRHGVSSSWSTWQKVQLL